MYRGVYMQLACIEGNNNYIVVNGCQLCSLKPGVGRLVTGLRHVLRLQR